MEVVSIRWLMVQEKYVNMSTPRYQLNYASPVQQFVVSMFQDA